MRRVSNSGDSYNNALAESTVSLFKTEIIDFMVTIENYGSDGMGIADECGKDSLFHIRYCLQHMT